MNSWMGHPYSGRMGRSPGLVTRISSMASRSSWSPETRATEPAGSKRIGKDHPAPTKPSLISSSDHHVRRAHDDGGAAAGHVAHAQGGPPPDEHSQAALG